MFSFCDMFVYFSTGLSVSISKGFSIEETSPQSVMYITFPNVSLLVLQHFSCRIFLLLCSWIHTAFLHWLLGDKGLFYSEIKNVILTSFFLLS